MENYHMKTQKLTSDPYNRVLAVVHLLGGQAGSRDLTPDSPEIDDAMEVVLEIERRFAELDKDPPSGADPAKL
jgi:hypothetical protein